MPHSPSTFNLKIIALCGVVLTTALGSRIAFATLGEPEESVDSDVARMKGAITVVARASYRVHEITLPSGTLLREYVAVNGGVFAVVWKGPLPPNLRQILGQYFDNYAAAAKATPRRDHLEIQQSDLVVQARGHMRAFSGRAYLPAAVPAGVNLEELN